MASPSGFQYKKKGETRSSPSAPAKTKYVPGTIKGNTAGDYVAMFLRGASGFAPGGFIGAGVGLVGEGLAQTVENREDYNFPQMGTQAALGAIPFGKAGSIAKGMFKGAAQSAGGNIATSIAEGQDIDPTNVMLATGLGAVGGGVTSKFKYKPKPTVETPKVKATKEVTKAVEQAKNIATEVKLDTKPKITSKIQLPKDLQGAKPRFNIRDNSYSPQFDNDIDKSLYILAQPNPSKREKDYLDFVIKNTGLDEKTIRIEAARVREQLKNNIKLHIQNQGESGDITIPKLHQLEIKAPVERIRTVDTKTGHDIMAAIEKESAIGRSIPKSEPQVELQASTNPLINKKTSNVISAFNFFKATSASGDLSAPLRQGIFVMGRPAWRNAWKPMVQALREGKYNEINAEIHNHPRYKEATDNGLMISDFRDIGQAEEQFASSIARRYVPGVKASDQAYTTFLNKLRMDLYNDLVTKAEKIEGKKSMWNLGKPMPPAHKSNIAAYVNAATGRGSMGLTVGGSSKSLEAAAPFLNAVFFSPRLIASRVQLLNPVSYVKLDPFTRKEALKDLATLTSVAGTALGLAKLNGAEVDFDPTSTEFAKIKMGNVRIDPLGGFSQYIRFFSQAVKGLSDENEKGPDPKRFIESKLSPSARFILETVSKKDYFGRKVTIPQSALNAFVPMITRDIYELYKEDPDLVPLAGLSAIGVGVQTYGEPGRKRSRDTSGIPRVRLPKLP